MLMQRRSVDRKVRVILSACVVAACAGLAMGEPEGQKPQEQPGDVLGGPKVNDDAKPGEMGKFAGREGRRDEIPHTLVVRLLKKMASETTPEEVRLTSAQATQLEEIEKTFQESTKAYREKNREEVMKLREVLPPEERRRVDAMMGGPEGRKPGDARDGKPGEGKPDAAKPGERRKGPRDDDAMAPSDDAMNEKPASREDVEKAKGRLKEIADGAPKPNAVNEQMYGVLNDVQRDYAKKEIEKAREEMRKRAEQRAKDRGGKGGEGDRMPPAVREKIEKLSPEEREKFQKMSPEEKRAYIRTLMGDKAK